MMLNVHWVVLVYKVPSEPTKYRATVWREIKRLGGVYLQDGVCIFPDVDDVSLNVSALAERVRKLEGTEYMFFTKSPTQAQASDLVEQFQCARDQEYAPLLTDAKAIRVSVDDDRESLSLEVVWERVLKLEKQVALVKARDYFDAPLGAEVIAELDSLRKKIAEFMREGDMR